MTRSRPADTTEWSAWLPKGTPRRIAPPAPCDTCSHHPGDHRGLDLRAGAHCTLCSGCAGYR